MTTGAPHTISFLVSNGTVSNDNNSSNEHVAPNDTVRFRSNATVYVKFTTGEWPFTETAPPNNEFPLTVHDGKYGAGPFTVAGNANAVNNYDVSLSAGGVAKTTGTVDIDPGR